MGVGERLDPLNQAEWELESEEPAVLSVSPLQEILVGPSSVMRKLIGVTLELQRNVPFISLHPTMQWRSPFIPPPYIFNLFTYFIYSSSLIICWSFLHGPMSFRGSEWRVMPYLSICPFLCPSISGIDNSAEFFLQRADMSACLSSIHLSGFGML